MQGNYWKMQISRRRTLAAGASLAALAGLSAAGCGDDGDDKPAGGPTSGPGGSQSPGAQGPTTLTTVDVGDPVSFDSTLNFSYRTCQLNSLTYPLLLQQKPSDNPRKYDVVDSLLAESRQQPDDRTIIFKLQSKARYEDKPPFNGRAVTATDIVNAWKYWSTKALTKVATEPQVDKIEAVDAGTLKFTLKRPSSTFLLYMAHPAGFYPIPAELVDADTAKKQPIGYGPFALERYDQGVTTTWAQNPNYWAKDKMALKKLDVRILTDLATAATAIRTKQIQVSIFNTNVPAQADVASLMRDLKDSTTFTHFPQFHAWYVATDLKMPLFKDARVRQAISLSINRDDHLKIQETGPSKGAWGGSLAPQEPWSLDPKAQNKDYGASGKFFLQDVKAAKDLLSSAGYTNGIGPFPLYINQGYGPLITQAGELLKQQLAEAGIKVDIVIQDNTAFTSTSLLGKYSGGAAIVPGPGQYEPDETLQLAYRADSGRSAIPGREEMLTPQAEPEFYRLLELQGQATDVAKRKDALFEMQRYLASKMYLVPIHVDPKTMFRSNSVVAQPLWAYNLAWLYHASIKA